MTSVQSISWARDRRVYKWIYMYPEVSQQIYIRMSFSDMQWSYWSEQVVYASMMCMESSISRNLCCDL